MPVIKSAKKKLRQDKKREKRNSVVAEVLKQALKKAKKSPTAESVRLATQATDKAVKYHLMHKNKAARVKSALSKLLSGKSAPKTIEAKSTKKKSPAPMGKKKATKKSSKK